MTLWAHMTFPKASPKYHHGKEQKGTKETWPCSETTGLLSHYQWLEELKPLCGNSSGWQEGVGSYHRKNGWDERLGGWGMGNGAGFPNPWLPSMLSNTTSEALTSFMQLVRFSKRSSSKKPHHFICIGSPCLERQKINGRFSLYNSSLFLFPETSFPTPCHLSTAERCQVFIKMSTCSLGPKLFPMCLLSSYHLRKPQLLKQSPTFSFPELIFFYFLLNSPFFLLTCHFLHLFIQNFGEARKHAKGSKQQSWLWKEREHLKSFKLT